MAAMRRALGRGQRRLASGHRSRHRARAAGRRARRLHRPRARAAVLHRLHGQSGRRCRARGSRRVRAARPAESCLADRRRAAVAAPRFSRYAHADAARPRARSATASAEAVTCWRPTACSAWMATSRRLRELARAAREHDAWLVVDDAHGLGVLGASGRGSLEHSGLSADDVPVLVGTLGKAFGSFGAFVAGSADLIELLIQKARPYIYTTALPQPVAAATRAALRVAQREAWRRERVLALTARFRTVSHAAGRAAGGFDDAHTAGDVGKLRRSAAGAEGADGRGFLGRGDPAADGAARQRASARHSFGGAHRMRRSTRWSRHWRALAARVPWARDPPRQWPDRASDDTTFRPGCGRCPQVLRPGRAPATRRPRSCRRVSRTSCWVGSTRSSSVPAWCSIWARARAGHGSAEAQIPACVGGRAGSRSRHVGRGAASPTPVPALRSVYVRTPAACRSPTQAWTSFSAA